MPALIHNSSALTSAGVALLSQSLEEAPSGLVRVNVEYALTQAKSASLASLFFLDAPPPVFPSVTRAQDLQGGGLLLESHSTSKSFGQWIVRANYVGSRNVRSGFAGLINRDDEARVTPAVKFLAGFNFSDDEVPRPIPVYDVVTVRYTAQTITRSLAGTFKSWFDLEQLGGDASGFIYRVEYGTISRGTPQVRTLFNYPSPLTILRGFKPVLNTSTKINNVTNAVLLSTTVQQVVLDNPNGPENL